MDKEDSQRKEKQEFLKKSIIDKGIPAKRFEQYIENTKSEALDVDNWTMDELSRVVDLFYKAEEEDNVNRILVDTNAHTPFKNIECEPIEFIEIVRWFNKRKSEKEVPYVVKEGV